MKLSNIMRDERTISIEIGDDNLNVTYKPSLITPISEDSWREENQESLFGAAVALKLSRLISKWDLTDEDGAPLALDEATLRTLPNAFLADVMRAINEDVLQKKVKKAPNSAGSFGPAA